MKNKEDPKKIWAKIVAKASSDDKFKEELLKHPEKVLKDNGIEIPKGHHINIHEDTETTTHLILCNNSHLNSEDIKKIFGGGYHIPGTAKGVKFF